MNKTASDVMPEVARLRRSKQGRVATKAGEGQVSITINQEDRPAQEEEQASRNEEGIDSEQGRFNRKEELAVPATVEVETEAKMTDK